MSGKTYRVKTGYGNLYITINNDEKGMPFEVFATIGKSGGFFQEQSEALCRLISLSLRSGIKIEEVIDNLKGIRGPMPIITDKGTILSLPDAIGKILEDHVKSLNNENNLLINKPKEEDVNLISIEQKEKVESNVSSPSKNKKSIADFGYAPACPECGSPLSLEEGCISCKNCGFSRCG
jgi:ribonucleoside-diphosphate reductase alpha chain